MRVDYAKSQTAGSELVITNLVSFTLLVSAVVFLGAVCRFLKKCCARLSGKGKKDHDAIAFTPVRRISQLRKSCSAPRICTEDYTVVHQEEPPIDTEDVAVQPEFSGLMSDSFLRPRAPTDPGTSPTVSRQISAPAGYSPPGLARGQTSPLARKILTRDWFSHGDIQTTDLEPKLYKKEASLQKFHTTSKHKCGTLDTEVYFDAKTSELKVTVNSIHQLLHKQHADETNTFVSVAKIPDQKFRRTSLHTKAIDPVYNDEFVFNIDPRDDISSHVLKYGLNHVDKFSSSYLRGEAWLPLFQIDLNLRQRVQIPFVEIKRNLFSAMYPVYHAGSPGCILISLKYEPEKQRIVVNPVRIRHVHRKRHVGYGKNVYIKVDLRHKGTRITKMKTQLTEMERMPDGGDFYQARFNRPLTLEYKSVPAETTEIHVSLNHYLFLKSSFIIGQVHMSRTGTGYESTHFQNMIDSPGEQIAVWYEMRGFATPTAMEEAKQ